MSKIIDRLCILYYIILLMINTNDYTILCIDITIINILATDNRCYLKINTMINMPLLILQ